MLFNAAVPATNIAYLRMKDWVDCSSRHALKVTEKNHQILSVRKWLLKRPHDILQ